MSRSPHCPSRSRFAARTHPHLTGHAPVLTLLTWLSALASGGVDSGLVAPASDGGDGSESFLVRRLCLCTWGPISEGDSVLRGTRRSCAASLGVLVWITWLTQVSLLLPLWLVSHLWGDGEGLSSPGCLSPDPLVPAFKRSAARRRVRFCASHSVASDSSLVQDCHHAYSCGAAVCGQSLLISGLRFSCFVGESHLGTLGRDGVPVVPRTHPQHPRPVMHLPCSCPGATPPGSPASLHAKWG